MIYLQTVVKFALSYWKKVHRDFYIVYFKNYTFHYFFFFFLQKFYYDISMRSFGRVGNARFSFRTVKSPNRPSQGFIIAQCS